VWREGLRVWGLGFMVCVGLGVFGGQGARLGFDSPVVKGVVWGSWVDRVKMPGPPFPHLIQSTAADRKCNKNTGIFTYA